MSELINNYSQKYKVVWYINNLCNFRCDYCLDKMGRQDEKMFCKPVDGVLVENLCDNVLTLGHHKYLFTLFGGETTLTPNLPEIVEIVYKKLGDNLNDFMFTTNASRGVDYFKQFLNFDSRFKIRVSVHFQHYTRELFEVIKLLAGHGVRVYMEIMYNLDYKDRVMQTAAELVEMKKTYPSLDGRIKPAFASLPFDPRNYFYPYSEKDIKDMMAANDKLGYHTYKYQNNRVQPGSFCIVGSNKILVEPTGNVLFSCPIFISDKKTNIYYDQPDKFIKNVFHCVRCVNKDQVCLHSPDTFFENRAAAKKAIKMLQE